MTRLSWAETGELDYQYGVDRGVLFLNSEIGIPWDGLISVQENVENQSETRLYVDGKSYRTQVRLGNFSAKISAFTYPEEFEQFDGYTEGGATAQKRTPFGFSYRTRVGTSGEHYKIHIVYNAIASPSARNYSTLGSSVTPTSFSWDVTTTPVEIPGARPSAHLIIDTRLAYPETVKSVEDYIYGNDLVESKYASFETILELFEANSILRITLHADGSYTATGPDDVVRVHQDGSFDIAWPSVTYIDTDTYQVKSL